MPDIDYDALAQQHGGAVDYDALAQQHGATESSDASVKGGDELLNKALNYHTGNNLVDAPMGFVQGAAKGLISTIHNGGTMLEKISALKDLDNAYNKALGRTDSSADWDNLTKPNGIGQGTGKFAEQTAEYMAPAGGVSKALKASPIAAKILAQAATGAGVSAVQSGGNPTSTILGGVLGAAGEAVPAAASGVKALAKDYAPNVQNFKTSMGAVPTQVPAIQRAMPTLIKDGIKPTGDVAAMKDALQGRLAELGQDYQALPKDIPGRQIPASDILSKLQAEADKFKTSGVVPSSMKAAYANIRGEIDTVQQIADAQGGKISFSDLQKLRDGANDLTDWTTPKGQRNLYDAVGNIYRGGMDAVAPETTPLNQDYQKYKELAGITAKNESYGRGGVTKSGLTAFGEKAGAGVVGAGLGYAAGKASGIPGMEYLGSAVGATMWPKLTGTAIQALKNAADNGSLAKLSTPARASLQLAMKAGDEGAISRLLGRAPVQIEQSATGN